MPLIHHEPTVDSVARFAADELRGWRNVRRGLELMRTSLALTLSVTFVCVLMWLVLDMSDRALAIVVLGIGHLAWALPYVIGLVLCCFAPPASATRRQARLVLLLISAGVFLLLLAAALGVAGVMFRPIPAASMEQALAIVALSFCVNLAIIGYHSIGLHAALGRDLQDPRSLTRAAYLASVLIGLFTAGAVLLLCSIFDLLPPLVARRLPPTSLLIGLAAMALIVLEAFYLDLIKQSRSTLRKRIGEPEERAASQATQAFRHSSFTSF